MESVEDHNQYYFGNTMGGKDFNAWKTFMASLRIIDAWNLDEFRKVRHNNFTLCKRFASPI